MMIRIACVAALAAIAACTKNSAAPVRSIETFADSADQVFYGVQSPIESEGVKRGTLFADTMYVMNDQTRFDFIQGRVEFNTDMGKPNGSMRADTGRVDQRTQLLEGWGNVIVKSADGRSLKSPHIIYNRLKDEVSSDTTFELVEPGRITTGKVFKTDTRLTRRECGVCDVKTKVAIPK